MHYCVDKHVAISSGQLDAAKYVPELLMGTVDEHGKERDSGVSNQDFTSNHARAASCHCFQTMHCRRFSETIRSQHGWTLANRARTYPSPMRCNNDDRMHTHYGFQPTLTDPQTLS